MNDAVALARLRIMSLAAVTALTGSSAKVYGGMLEQSVAPPAVLVQRVGETARGHLRGGDSLWVTRIQVTSVAMSRSDAVAIDQAIYGDGAGNGLAFWIGGIGSPAVDVRLCDPAGVVEDYVAGELRQWRVIRDYMVHHR